MLMIFLLPVIYLREFSSKNAFVLCFINLDWLLKLNLEFINWNAHGWEKEGNIQSLTLHDTWSIKTKKLQTENLPLWLDVPNQVLITFIYYAEIITEVKGAHLPVGIKAKWHKKKFGAKKVKVYYLSKWHHAQKYRWASIQRIGSPGASRG